MADPLTLASFSLDFIKGVVTLGRGGFKHFKGKPPEEILKIRLDMRKECEKNMPRPTKNHTPDLLVRDIDRMDYYLHENPKRAYASYAWFRNELKGYDHRAIHCFISMPVEVVYEKEKKKWRFAKRDEKGIVAYPVGSIAYEQIVKIDWNGDGYYPYPHIYVKYKKGSPYYTIRYHLREGSEEHEYFREIEGWEPHKKRLIFI